MYIALSNYEYLKIRPNRRLESQNEKSTQLYRITIFKKFFRIVVTVRIICNLVYLCVSDLYALEVYICAFLALTVLPNLCRNITHKKHLHLNVSHTKRTAMPKNK